MQTPEKERCLERLLVIGYLCFMLIAVLSHYLLAPWGFYRATEQKEAGLRMHTVTRAQSYLGCQEADGSHEKIIDLYNAHEPLAVDYTVQYGDSWCAAFVSAVAIDRGLTDIIPTECGCERQIALWQEMGRWQEADSHIPQPGDLIYYDWEDNGVGDCSGWSDHVGMVVGVKWPFIKVIEGNKDDSVSYRVILVNSRSIRGFGLPDYGSK